MSVSSHVLELKKKHHILSREVEEEQRALAVDPTKLAAMKKQKLKLKEEIQRFSD
jgi:hypothetical protein